MDQQASYTAYQDTGYFSKIVSDYLQQSPLLQPFYLHPPTLEGIQKAIIARQAFDTPRALLTEVLLKQYEGIQTTERVQQNIEALKSPDGFAITTAHQPNIFTGPLFFIYKIIHAIKLADELNARLPAYRFVPVYYMGSEDADLEEIGHVYVGGQKLVWDTKQTGSVGRMKVDKQLVKLIEVIHGQAGVLPFGNELRDMFTRCYSVGKTIQQASLELINTLFGQYGLVVLVPDDPQLKKEFLPVVIKELGEKFSHVLVAEAIKKIGQHYKVQAGGREINLFYLLDNKRERIEAEGGHFTVRNLGLQFSKEALVQEATEHPERFSANVILRGVFQEMLLPGVAFIGGGGELAYWLEFKSVFAAVNVPYPVLLLRNSFLLLKKIQEDQLFKLGLKKADLFKDALSLVNDLVKRESNKQLDLSGELQQAHDYYDRLQSIAGKVDPTLAEHVRALEKQAIKRLMELEKKILRAERSTYTSKQHQVNKLKNDLFPGGSLQERTDNFSIFYAAYGSDWFNTIYKASAGLDQAFGIVTL